MLNQTSRTFKRDVIGYAKLRSGPIGTLRESPLMPGDRSSGINMRRITQPVLENRGTVLNRERDRILERGTENRNSPILDQVVDTPVRREGIPISDILNNEDNISRPASRMSNSEHTNNGSNNNISNNNQLNNNSFNNNELNNNNSNNNEFNNNNNNESYNNRPARRMSVSDMLNKEGNISRPASRMSDYKPTNIEGNINRPSSRMSDYDPTNKNIKKFLGFSFGVDYSGY